MSSLSATLRIARRDAARAKVRSALVVMMIALPVLGVGAADVVWRTFQLSEDQTATREMGRADAIVEASGAARITQGADGGYEPVASAGAKAPQQLSSVLPADTTVVEQRSTYGRLTAGELTTEAELRALDYEQPIAEGIVTQREGRAPSTADEVALTARLAERLGVRPGDRVRIRANDFSVVGVVNDGKRRDAQVALLSSLPKDWLNVRTTTLIDAPRPLLWSDVERANSAGFIVHPRSTLPGTPAVTQQPGGFQPEEMTAIALIVGLILLEIVLLAGPAFAVGAKRQSRDLALLAASGGERRDVRRTVLSSGLVLGALGGVMGVTAGVLIARLAIGPLSERTGDIPGPFDLRPLELAGLVLVGMTTALVAAVLPARNAARQDVVAALTGRRGQLRSLRRTPVLGAIAAVVGAATALEGARQRNINVILAGSMMAELGLVATTPFLVGLAGRLSPHLPLGPRLALRDASRNRGRTAPAVSAVLAAVAGSVAIGTFVASQDQYDREAYQPTAVSGSVVVPFHDPELASKRTRVEQLLDRHLPDSQAAVVRGLGATDERHLAVSTPKERACPVSTDGIPTRAALLAAERHPACRGTTNQHMFPTSWLVGTPAHLTLLTGQTTPAQEAVLLRGGAVLPAHTIDARGQAHFTVTTQAAPMAIEPRAGAAGPETEQQPQVLRSFSVPAVALPPGTLAVGLLSPAAAALAGLPISEVGMVALGQEAPSTGAEDRLRKGLEDLGLTAMHVERGYVSDYGLGLLALLLGSAVIVLGASGIATGLAAADGKADLATLAAVGASPRTRRSLAAFQSAVTAGLGTLLGVAAGLVPAIGMVRALNAAAREAPFPRLDPYPLVLPWTNLLVTVLVVPLLAAAAAALLTRSRLPLVRRIA